MRNGDLVVDLKSLFVQSEIHNKFLVQLNCNKRVITHTESIA